MRYTIHIIASNRYYQVLCEWTYSSPKKRHCFAYLRSILSNLRPIYTQVDVIVSYNDVLLENTSLTRQGTRWIKEKIHEK